MWSKIRNYTRKRCTADSTIEGTEIKNLSILTIAFQLVFTGFHALQNLHSSLHDEENLGLVCLSVIYGTSIVSSALSPAIIGKFGVKAVLVTAFAAHIVYILANFYASWATMIPGAIFLGALHGPAWTSQGVYVSACSYSYSKTSSTSPFSILSKFNGFFFAVIATTQIFGNIFTSLVIRDGIGNKSEVIVFKYCGPRDCPSNENATEIEDPEAWVIDLTLLVFMALAAVGLLLTFFALTSLPRSEWDRRVSPREMTVSFVQVLVTTNMPLLIPFIVFTGMGHALLLGSFTKSYIACPIGIHMVGYVMAVYGVTTPIFFIIFSKLVRVTGRFLLIMGSSLIHLVVLLLLLHWEPSKDDEVIVFLVPVIWGMAESIQEAQANALIALLFPDKKEPAFANFHAWRSLGYCVTFLNVAYICVKVKVIVCIICLVLGSGLYVFVEIQTKAKEKTSAITNQEMTLDKKEVWDSDILPYSIASFPSIQDRLSFHHFELADIIKDAEVCWRRNDSGNMTLEVEKVMSTEHLRESKVTTLFHTRPQLETPNQHTEKVSPSIPRSKSDAQLSTAQYRLHQKEAGQKRRVVSSMVENAPNKKFGFRWSRNEVIKEEKGYEDIEECVYDSIRNTDFNSDSGYVPSFKNDSDNNSSNDGQELSSYVGVGEKGDRLTKYKESHDKINKTNKGAMFVSQIQNFSSKNMKISQKASPSLETSSSGSPESASNNNNIIAKMNKRPPKKSSSKNKLSPNKKGFDNTGFEFDETSNLTSRQISREESKRLQAKSKVPKSKTGLLKKRRPSKSLHVNIEKRNSMYDGETHPDFAPFSGNQVDFTKFYKRYTVSDVVRTYMGKHNMDSDVDADSDGFVDVVESDVSDSDDSFDHHQFRMSPSSDNADTISIY